MTTIVSGNNLGLSTSSLAVLGSDGGVGDGTIGRSGEKAYVDVSNGNLVIQHEDDLLVGVGISTDTVRTYNSQATIDGDNNDNWRIGLYKRVYNLTGTVNTAGSTVTRTDGDGADVVYTYDAPSGRYRATDGAGAYDTLSYSLSGWAFIDGTTQQFELYDTSGRITAAWDKLGDSKLTYNYTGSLLTSVVNQDGETTFLDYTGNLLQDIRDVHADGTTSTRVHYDYDTNGRLWHVKVDLSPDDNSIADGKVYQTTYTYDGNSTRVIGVSNTDGTGLAIQYVLVGTTYKVASVTDGLGRLTTFTYKTNNIKTIVTDPMSFQTTYSYDAKGQLTSVVAPAVGLVSPTRSFAYDANGNVTQTVDGAGRVQNFTYDPNTGNLLTAQDALGNTTTRTFNWVNQLLTETTTGASGPMTTRNVYDPTGLLLLYTLTPEGRVTRNTYDANTGSLTSTIHYTDAAYDVSTLGQAVAPTLTQMGSWASGVDASKITRTDYTYDFRGQLATATDYATVTATGAGVLDAAASTTHFVYDPAGNLLQTISPNGAITYHAYDGLNRLFATDEAAGTPQERMTVTIYDDAGAKTTVTTANLLQTVQYYNAGNQLFKVAEIDGSGAALSQTQYTYDADGRLRAVQDTGTGMTSYMLYDADGNKVGDVDGNGSLTEYQYDGSGQVISTIRYATPVSTAGLPTGTAIAPDVSIASIRPVVTPYNVALASSGAVATASSSAMNYPASSLINGDRKGVGDGMNGDWKDNTSGAFPDWVEVDFAGWKSITQVNVYSTQDNVASPVEPTDTMTFTQLGATSFTVQGWDGAQWVTLGVVTGNNLVKRAVTFAAFTTNKIRVNINAAASASSRLAEIEAIGVDAAQPPIQTNVALASAGATASASSVYSAAYSPSLVIDNERRGAGYASGGGGWTDGTQSSYPDWVEIDFNGTKTINRAVVYTLQDNYTNPIEPTDTTTFSAYGVTAFDVQGWNGTSWVTLASVTGNNLVKRTVLFNAFTTDRIRIQVNASGTDSMSRLTEVEAWGVDAAPMVSNVALTGTVTASSTYAASYPASSLNNNERAGAPWGNYSSWIDNTPGTYPDWVEIDFNNTKTIDHVVVYSLQDNYSAPVEPTDTMTFSTYGTTDFDVQAWVNGTWTTVASVRGNNLVKRTASFTAVSTSKIRINVLGTKSGYTYLTEIEAWGYTTQVDTNQALATAGATASASSENTTGGSFGASSLINNERAGANWGTGTSWADNTSGVYPDWVEVDFNGLKTINKVVAYSIQDNYTAPVQPTDTMTSTYAVTDYDVQAWVNGAWTTVASVRGNALVKSVASFTAGVITNRIRINILSTPKPFSHLTEVEAWGSALPVAAPPPVSTQVTTTIRDAAGRIVKQVDPAGYVTQTVYDGAGLVTDVIQYALPIDRNLLPANPSPANATPVASPLDRHTRNFYDKDGNLVGTLDAEGYLTTYTYDKAGRQVQSYKYANPTTVANRAAGTLAQLIPATSINDVVAATIFNLKGQVAATVDAESYLTENVYDDDGNLTTSIRYSTTVAYTPGMTLAALRPASDPNAQVRSYTYDALDQMVSSTDGEGTITQYTYDKVGNLTSKTIGVGRPEKRTLTTRYDALGRVIGELNGIGSALLTGNETQAQLDQIFAQYGTTYTYDSAGNRTSATDADGNKTFFYYALDGRLVYTVDGTGAVVEHRYNALNQEIATVAYATRLTSLAGLTGGMVSLAAGQAQLQLDPVNDRTTLIAYDTDGNVASKTDALGFKTLYSYDGFGDLTAKSTQIDATTWLGNAYGYDNRGLLVNELDDTIATSRQYDAFGRLVGTVDGNGNLRSYFYDRLGREVQATGPAAITNTTTVYDAFSRVMRTTDLVQNTTTTYAYNLATKTVTVTSPEGVAVAAQHDALGQKVSVTVGTGPDARTTSYTYDLDGNLVTTSDGLGDGTQNIYDHADRLFETVNLGTQAGAVMYTYDAVGRVLTRTADVNAHDGMASGLNVATTTTYDAFGDKVLVVANGATSIYSWDRDGDLTLQVTDAFGVGFATQFTYDGRGDALSVTAGTALTTYAYDKLGRRIAQHVDPNGLNLTTTYEYDNDGNVVAVTDPNGNRTRQVYDQDDRMVYRIDGAGDVTQLAYDSNGNVVQERDYATPVALANLAPNPSMAAVQTALAPLASVYDHVISTVYDGDGRAIYQLDGGSLTKRRYDASGNVVELVTYAAVVPAGTAATRASLDAWSAANASATDNHVRTVYDAANRALFTVDGTNGVVEYVYDRRNNVIEKIAFAGTLPAGTPMDFFSILGWLPRDPAHDQDIHYAYDGLSRLRFTIDGAGGVTENKYDAAGNVREKICYTTPISNLNGDYNEVTIAARVASFQAPNDRHQWLYYDGANRLVYTVDSAGTPGSSSIMGDVTQLLYDSAGNIKERVHYATRISLSTPPATLSAVRSAANAVIDATHDLHERFRYDGANRLAYSATATGAVTKRVYDGDGNVVSTVQYATPIASTAEPSTVATSNFDRTTMNYYDAANRLVFSQDSSGAIVENDYDGKGNVVTVRQYYTFNYIPPGSTLANVIALAAARTNANDRVQHKVYDSANHLVYEVSALNFVKRTDYDGVGRVTGTRDFATVLAAGTPMTVTGIGAVVHADPVKDQAATFAYDGAGRLQSSTDALSKSESYAYDGAGNKVSYTNKLNATWTYGHDAAGRVTSETTPNVDTTTLNPVSGGYQVVTTNGKLTTYTYYDAMGRVIRREENVPAGGTPTRVTLYMYDARDRQIETIFPAVATYNAGADFAGNAARVENAAASPISSVIYNARGDAVVSQDVSGNWSYKAYDLAGRVIYEIDAEGYITKHDWDAFGDETAVTRYSTRVTGFAAGQELTVEAINTLLTAQGIANDPNRRVLTKAYDAMGRLQTTTQGAAFYYDSSVANATTSGVSAAMTTSTAYTWNLYDAFGEVFQSGTQRDALAGKWDLTTYYYDQAGNKTLEVDSLGYATAYGYDAENNLTSETEYASPIAGWSALNQLETSTRPTPVATANTDRTTIYTYDVLNRKLTETRLNVEYSAASDGTSTRGNLATSYAYDAVGNLVQTTDATGASTFTFYDALGRTTAVMAPTIIDEITGQFFTPLTEFKHDASGDVVAQTAYKRGSVGLDIAGRPLADDSDASNRTTISVHDIEGNLTESVDATGHSKFFSYDAAGHLMKQWETVTQEAANKLVQTFSYDKLGRQVDSVEYRRDTTTGQYTAIHNQTTYNAFGEVTAKGVNGSTDDTYEYDTAGRLWRARGSDGVLTVYLYDFSGLSAQITSPTVSLTALGSASQISSMWGVLAPDVHVHDLHGRETQEIHVIPPSQTPTTNWVTQNYSAQEAMDIAFLQLDQQTAGTVTFWANGTVTRGPGTMATYADNQGRVTTFDIEKGALAAVKLSDSMRIGLQAQFNAIFTIGVGNFIPQNLKIFRQEELDFDNYFTDPQFGNGRVIQWMGGTLQQTAPGVALFIDGNGNHYTFTAAAGILPILNQFSGNSTIRLGWERDYGVRFVGDGGEEMVPIVVGFGAPSGGAPTVTTIGSEGSSTEIDWSSNTVSLTWGDIGDLGDGDVQAQIYYTDRSYDTSSGQTSAGVSGRTQTVQLSSVAGAHGATLSWLDPAGTNGGVWEVDRAVVSKKDVNGNWQVVLDQQNGQGPANQIPSLFSVAASQDPAIQVQVQVSTDNVNWTTATGGFNFGDRIVFQNLPASASTVYYRVSTLQNGLVTLRSSGTIAAQVPVLATISPSNQPYIDTASKTIIWGAATKAFDPNAPAQHMSIRRDYYGIIQNGTAYLTYRTVASFLQNFMQSTTIPVGYSQYWAGGTLYRAINNSAYFIYGGKTYSFSLNETLQEIVSRSPGMRAAVEATYGAMFQLDPNGYYASNDPGTGAVQMEISFDEFFDNHTGYYPVGVVISNWAGGTLTKNADGTATFRHAGEPDYVFRKSDGPYKIIDQNAHIRQQWASEYHITLSQSQWTEISDPGGQSVSASIANLGPGTYQYELIYDRGLLPYAHATGNFTVGEQAITGGYGFTAITTTNFRNSIGDGLANLRYDTALWFTYPPGTARSWIGGGMLILAKTGNAYWAPATSASPQGAYTFTNNVQAVINDPSYDAGLIRQGWQSEFGPGYDTHWVPNPPWIWNEVVADTAQFFWDTTDFPVGIQLNWYGGTLWKYSANAAMYIQPNGQYYYFNSSSDPAAMADANPYIRNGWASDPGFAGLTFTPTTAPMLDLSNDTSLFFNDNTDYPQGYVQTWFQGTPEQGTLIKGVNGSGVAYYIPGYPFIMGISPGAYPAGSGQPFEFNASMDVLSIAQNNADIMAGWEQQYSMFGLEFGWGQTGTVTHDALTYAVNADANPGTAPISLSLTGPAYSPVVATSSVPAAAGDSVVVTKTLDRWGNTLTETDARNGNWVTKYTYNASNQVTEEDQMQAVNGVLVGRAMSYDEHGAQLTTLDAVNAATKTFYDQVGRVVAVTDANDKVNGAVYDKDGELVEQRQADNGVIRYEYDLFGEKIRMRDTLGNDTTYGYDKMGRLTTVTHAATDVYAGTGSVSNLVGHQSRVETYGYDEAGRRVLAENGSGQQAIDEAVRYEYDEHGNLVKTIQPLTAGVSATTTDTWDVRNNKASEVDADGNRATWQYDAYGHVLSHVDLNGDTTAYTYDWRGELVEQTKRQGTSGAGAIKQHLSFQYDLLGRQTRIDDAVEGSSTIYAYDKAGNKTEEQTTKGGIVYQDNLLSYDALGRLSEDVDSRHHVWIKYDAAGNRREVKSYYTDDANTLQQVDNWYTYNSMNRMLVDNGRLFGTTIGINTVQGVSYTYDTEGNQLSATQWGTTYANPGDGHDGNSDYVTEYYSYDEGNRLKRSAYGTDVAGTDAYGNTLNTTGIRHYDAAGRVESETSYNLSKIASQSAAGGDDHADTRHNDYDLAGRITQQIDIDYKNGTRYTATYDTYDGVGNLKHSHLQYRGDFSEDTTYTYVSDDTYHQATVNLNHSNQPTETTTMSYDANGHLKTVTDSGNATNNRTFVNDVAGSVLARADGIANAGISLTDDAVRGVGGRIEHMLVVDEQTVGLSAKAYTRSDGSSGAAVDRFDFGAQGVSSLGDAPSHYILTGSDAALGLVGLQHVAQAVYGDSTLWYVIAEANGLTSDADVRSKAGITLTIPSSVTTSKNDVRTFKPWDPSVIKGDTTPSLPKPTGDQGCGTMGQLIVAAVVIVVAAITEQWYLANYAQPAAYAAAGTEAAVEGSSLDSIAGAYSSTFATQEVIGSVVGAGVGNIAGQAVGNAIGEQHGFSFQSLVASMASAGIGTELAQSGIYDGLSDTARNAAKAAANNAVNQGIHVALGMQKQFSWAAVAASAIASPIANAAGNKAAGLVGNPLTSLGARMVQGFTSGVVTEAAVQVATGGKIQWENVAADAFGNALGSSLASTIEQETTPSEYSDKLTARGVPNVLDNGVVHFASFDRAGNLILKPGDEVVEGKTYRAADGTIAYAYPNDGGTYDIPEGAQALNFKELRYNGTTLGRDYGTPQAILDAVQQSGVTGGDPVSGLRLQVAVDTLRHPDLAQYIDPGTGQVNPLQWSEFKEAAANASLPMLVTSNGLANWYQQARDNARILAQGKDVLAVNVYNPTISGQFWDDTLFEFAPATFLGQQQTVQVAIKAQLREALDYNAQLADPTDTLGAVHTVFVGHSQGSLNGNVAIEQMTPSEKRLLDVYNVGTATTILPHDVASFTSIFDQRDLVPLLTGGRTLGDDPYALAHPDTYHSVPTDIGRDEPGNHHSLYLYAQTPQFRDALNFLPRPEPILMTRPF